MSQNFDDTIYDSTLATPAGTHDQMMNNIKALATSFSGPNEPGAAIRRAGLPWHKSDTDEFYIRNAANDGWIGPFSVGGGGGGGGSAGKNKIIGGDFATNPWQIGPIHPSLAALRI